MMFLDRRDGSHAASVQRHSKWWLFAIILLSIVVRGWSIGNGLPYLYHPDEPHYVQISQDIIRTGDFNPHFFNYPSLFFYLNALIYLPFVLVGNITGSLRSFADIPTPSVLVLGVGYTAMPATVLMGRILTLIISTGSVLLVYYIANRLTHNRAVSLLASLLMAVSPTNVINSRFITPDTLVTFFVLLSFCGSVNVYQRAKTTHYVLAGVAAGLATGSKYNGVLIITALLAAHFFGEGVRDGLRERRLYGALLAAGVAFLLTTPFAIFDFPKFISDVSSELQHYSSGHIGMDGNPIAWYTGYLWANEGIIALFAVVEVVRAIYMRLTPIILLVVFPAAYFAFINAFVVRNDRTLLPMMPFIFLLGASFLARLLDSRPYLQPAMRNSPIFAGVALALVAVAFSAVQMVNGTNNKIDSIKSREIAVAWTNQHLPKGSTIAIESYSPYIDQAYFKVGGFTRIIDYDPQWYLDRKYNYLVFSQLMFGRYYNERVKYALEVEQYDDFFRSFDLVQVFHDQENEIRIYSVRQATGAP
ncbi:MAG TPA: phospholipid carrier-dependent glycosyltransferase [Chloroflexia bacterium]|jgi:4-amino-4-deoxy-L-arabinose transferase-like glycosyltransferase